MPPSAPTLPPTPPTCSPLNPPPSVWAVISSFLDPKTAAKIEIIGGDYHDALAEYGWHVFEQIYCLWFHGARAHL